MLVGTIFLVFALVLFAIAAIGVASGKYNLIAAGLFFWVLSLLASSIFK